MSANNESRKFANQLANAFGWEKEGNGNFFRTRSGAKVNITMTTSGKIESRQFTLDCDYLACYDVTSKKIAVHKKEDLSIGNVTRINSKGVMFYQASLK
jgi:hypothetical protein